MLNTKRCHAAVPVISSVQVSTTDDKPGHWKPQCHQLAHTQESKTRITTAVDCMQLTAIVCFSLLRLLQCLLQLRVLLLQLSGLLLQLLNLLLKLLAALSQ